MKHGIGTHTQWISPVDEFHVTASIGLWLARRPGIEIPGGQYGMMENVLGGQYGIAQISGTDLSVICAMPYDILYSSQLLTVLGMAQHRGCCHAGRYADAALKAKTKPAWRVEPYFLKSR